MTRVEDKAAGNAGGMEFREAGGFAYAVERACDPAAPCIWCMGMKQGFQAMGPLLPAAEGTRGDACTVVKVVVDDWDDQMTPWPAPGLYPGDADFKGCADETLRRLVDQAMPALARAEGIAPARHAVCGYSLGGLFSLYAFLACDVFQAVGSMSGSVWYPQWAERLEDAAARSRRGAAAHAWPREDLEGTFAYLSLGLQEAKARPAILHSVQRNTELTAHVLEAWGAQVQMRLVPGNHFHQVDERVRDGVAALAGWLTGPAAR